MSSSAAVVLIKEAEEAFRSLYDKTDPHGRPLVPPAWKRNIRPFLKKCLVEVPYISHWSWAIKALREWCRAAPFRYFKLVLLNPRKYRVRMGDPTKWLRAHDWRVFYSLKAHKGLAAARAWGIWKGLIQRSQKRMEQDRREAEAAIVEELVGPPPSLPAEIFERDIHERIERSMGYLDGGLSWDWGSNTS